MTGILSANPDGPLFVRAMQDLQAEARVGIAKIRASEVYLPQVHALNCLKDIFTSTKLGQRSEAFIPQALDLAGERLQSRTWAIRNCGLMLLRALIDRLFGTNESQASDFNHSNASRMSYHRYPNLLEIVVALLRTRERDLKNDRTNQAVKTQTLESVFPALEILRRAPPPAERVEEIRGLVENLLRSRDWHVRDMAARVMARLSVLYPRDGDLSDLLLHCRVNGQNELHGRLLSVQYILRMRMLGIKSSSDANDTKSRFGTGRYSQPSPDLEEIIVTILQNSHIYSQNSCPFTKAAFVDIHSFLIGELPELYLQNNAGYLHCEAYRDFGDLIGRSNSMPDSFLLLRSLACYLALYFLHQPSDRTSLDQIASVKDRSRDCFLDMLSDLAVADADACCFVLLSLDRHAAIKREDHIDLVLLHAVVGLLLTSIKSSIASTALTVTWSSLQRLDGASHSSRAQTDKTLIALCSSALFDLSIVNPSASRARLRLWGRVMRARHQLSRKWSTRLLQTMEHWVRAVAVASKEGNVCTLGCCIRLDTADRPLQDFAEREAAVQSMIGFGPCWYEPSKPPNALFVEASLVLYDALNDDDDEIRDLAALVTSKLLRGKGAHAEVRFSLAPLVASQKLSEYLAARHRGSQKLGEGALTRLTGTLEPCFLDTAQAGSVIGRVRQETTILFAEERQNLFIDEVREAVVWSRVLKRLSDAALPAGTVHHFTAWVIDGLTALKDAASRTDGGALGWTSNPEVFALGVRLIYGAEVLLHWTRKVNRDLTMRLRLCKAMTELQEVKRGSHLHEIWLERIEFVLAQAVVAKLANVKVKLDKTASAIARIS